MGEYARVRAHTYTHTRTHTRKYTHARSRVYSCVRTMFRPIFRPMFRPIFRPIFRNKVTFKKWPPNTKYALGGLRSYKNKVSFYIKGNLKGNLISEHVCKHTCAHIYDRACVHVYVRVYMYILRVAVDFQDPPVVSEGIPREVAGGVIGMPWIYYNLLILPISSSTRKFHNSTRLGGSQTVQHVKSNCPSFEICHVKSWPKKSASGHCISPTRLSYHQSARPPRSPPRSPPTRPPARPPARSCGRRSPACSPLRSPPR